MARRSATSLSAGMIQQILIGDATDERFMKSLGVDNFDLAVIAIGENFQTVLERTSAYLHLLQGQP